MLDFPSSPTTGQKYPTPAVAGVPQYTWDGEKWTTVGGSIVSATPATATPLMDATPAVVGTTTKFAREDHVHPTDTSRADDTAVVKSIAQSLTTTQQQQARSNIFAAPFDALAYSGMQINGAMEVSQERGTAGTNAAGTYVCDGWQFTKVGTMVVGAAIAAGPLVGGIPNLLYITPSTAQASLGSGDVVCVVQPIEGYRCARLGWATVNAQPITIGFWSEHHRAGLYSGTLRNADASRSYAFSYTQNVADVPQYNTITIPGCTDGTWKVDNTAGLFLTFAMAAGSTFIAPAANTWQAGNYLAAPGQVNGVAATSDVFRIAGVIVVPGTEAPSAARSPFIMRPYDQELATCQRYYEQVSGSYRLTGTSNAYAGTSVSYLTKRAIPTLTFTASPTLQGSTFHSFIAPELWGVGLQFNATANTDSFHYGFRVTADARL